MVIPIPITSESTEQRAASLVVEIERDIFMGLLDQAQKPFVLEHHAGFPKTYRYFLRMGGYYFMYRSREREDLAARASVLTVKAFFDGPKHVT